MSILLAAGCCCDTGGQFPTICGNCVGCAGTILGQCRLISEVNNPDPPGSIPAYDVALDMTATAIVFDKAVAGADCGYVPHAFPNAVVSGIVFDSNPPSFPVACPNSYECEGFQSPVTLVECVVLDATLARIVGTPTAWRIILVAQCSSGSLPSCEQFGPGKKANQSYEILCAREVVCPVIGAPKAVRITLGAFGVGLAQTSGWIPTSGPLVFTNNSTNSTVTVALLDVSFA